MSVKGMMNNAFSGQLLAEKLSKLNNSQQSIETLSHWCIFHRKKAKQVVETWDKLFNSAQKEQRVSFLYLANDILQNSRRKGSEFVNEFWKVLPAALKDVFENNDEYGKKAVSRLVNIWEERKVFGSRGQSLKDEMLGKDPPPLLENNGKISNPIKIVRKDATSIRIKLAIGGLPEKIVTAFQSVHDELSKEDAALGKCKAAADHVEKIGKEVEFAFSQENEQAATLENELLEQESILCQCIKQLESVEAARGTLIRQLKEALQDQESKWELIHTQLQVAQAQIAEASNIRQRLGSSAVAGPTTVATSSLPMETNTIEPAGPTQSQTTSSNSQPPLPQPITCFATSKIAKDEDDKKATAAAVAAKLAAMTSSAQMLTSVLSSLVAEEAASMNGGPKSGTFTSSLPIFSPEKRPKLEKPMSVSDTGNLNYFTPVQQQPMPNLSTLLPLPVSSITGVQPLTHTKQVQVQPQSQFPPPPPLPLPPLSVQPYVQSSSVMVGAMPYGYSSNSLPPPPPLPTHMIMGLARPNTRPQQQHPQPQPQPQQQQATGGYYQSSGVGFYAQSPQKPR